jgi:hypothetical protein
MGVWLDLYEQSACSMSPTGFHHPAGAQPIAEAAEVLPNIAAIKMPPEAVMYVVALTTGSYYTSVSYLEPEGPMSKIEAAAMLHQIARGWENQAAQEIAQAN